VERESLRLGNSTIGEKNSREGLGKGRGVSPYYYGRNWTRTSLAKLQGEGEILRGGKETRRGKHGKLERNSSEAFFTVRTGEKRLS